MSSPLKNYLQQMSEIRRTGSAVKETSFYGTLENLFNKVGKTLKPRVRCVINLQNRGAGLPDGGFFTPAQFQRNSNELIKGQLPERGAIEIKGTSDRVSEIAETKQVNDYLQKYRQVLVTNYRDFLLVRLDENNSKQYLESFSLAEDENDFWQKADNPGEFSEKEAERFIEFLKRVMLSAAPISKPEDVAWFLASYARDAKARVEEAELDSLAAIRKALEEALGIRFEGEKGENFFRSTLVQTLFYGIFSAWVLWHKRNPKTRENFNWKTAVWELRVPMISVLFEQIATPSNLKNLNLVEVLDWTGNVLNRVVREEFFQRFAEEHAVQYFYEPFLQAFDPNLRKELGVWYTPEEIVRYMVERVDRVLREELDLPDGLADESVYILDPACGTGAYLVEVLRRINQTLEEKGEDAVRGQRLKRAVMTRVFGFEILPAPFVVSHLQIGLLLEQLGVGLSDERRERAGVYLTNSLTGWDEHPKTKLPFPEFEEERDRADQVKKEAKILVILGNPPYNAFAGVSPEEENNLVEPYKQGLISEWGIKKFNLDDLYVRFFRLAERRIAEKTRKGIVCYISNFSYLRDPSFVVMRKKFLSEFDKIWIDCLNGDSRETGKLTPKSKPDPSVFSTEFNREGIRVGTAIGLFVRKENHTEENPAEVFYREFWGANKRKELLESLDLNFAALSNVDSFAALPPDVRKGSAFPEDNALDFREAEPRGEFKEASDGEPQAHRTSGGKAAESESQPFFKKSAPAKSNRFSLRPSDVSNDYQSWAKLTDLCRDQIFQGLDEDRAFDLIDIDKEKLSHRIQSFLNPQIEFESLKKICPGLTRNSAEYDGRKARQKFIDSEEFNKEQILLYHLRPFDVRWCYYTTVNPIWKRPRPKFSPQISPNNGFLITRPSGVASPEGVPFLFVKDLIARDAMRGHAVAFPFHLYVSSGASTNTSQMALFDSVNTDLSPKATDSIASGETRRHADTNRAVAEGDESADSNSTLSESETSPLPSRRDSPDAIEFVRFADNKTEQSAAFIHSNQTRANLSEKARLYLQSFGFTDIDESAETASLIWYHALAIGYSSEYLAENADGIRQDFPRIPLPAEAQDLIASAQLGRLVAELLDTERQVAGVTAGSISPALRVVGVAAHAEGKQFQDDDFKVTAGWGHAGKDGATMPGKGKLNFRDYTETELTAMGDDAKLLGERTFDVFLNDVAFWRNVPERVWQFYIGGYQVLKKWLSYREFELLGRALTLDEITEVTNMTRRISAILLLEPQLNENYRKIKANFYKQ